MALTHLSVVPGTQSQGAALSSETTPLGEVSETYVGELNEAVGAANAQEILEIISRIQRDDRVPSPEKVQLMEHFFDVAMSSLGDDLSNLSHMREVVSNTILETNRILITLLSEGTKSALIDFLCRPVEDHDVTLTSRVAALEVDAYSNTYPEFKKLDDASCRELVSAMALDMEYRLRKRAAEIGEEREALELAQYIARQIAKHFHFACPEIFAINGQPENYIYWWIDQQLGLAMSDDYFKNSEQRKNDDITVRTCMALRHGYQRALGRAYAFNELGFETDGPEFNGYEGAPEIVKLQAKQYFWAGILYPGEHSSFAAPTESSLYRDATQFSQHMHTLLRDATETAPPQGVGRLAA